MGDSQQAFWGKEVTLTLAFGISAYYLMGIALVLFVYETDDHPRHKFITWLCWPALLFLIVLTFLNDICWDYAESLNKDV